MTFDEADKLTSSKIFQLTTWQADELAHQQIDKKNVLSIESFFHFPFQPIVNIQLGVRSLALLGLSEDKPWKDVTAAGTQSTRTLKILIICTTFLFSLHGSLVEDKP